MQGFTRVKETSGNKQAEFLTHLLSSDPLWKKEAARRVAVCGWARLSARGVGRARRGLALRMAEHTRRPPHTHFGCSRAWRLVSVNAGVSKNCKGCNAGSTGAGAGCRPVRAPQKQREGTPQSVRDRVSTEVHSATGQTPTLSSSAIWKQDRPFGPQGL